MHGVEFSWSSTKIAAESRYMATSGDWNKMCAAIGAAVRPRALVVDDSQVNLCRSVCLYTDLSNVPFALVMQQRIPL